MTSTYWQIVLVLAAILCWYGAYKSGDDFNSGAFIGQMLLVIVGVAFVAVAIVLHGLASL